MKKKTLTIISIVSIIIVSLILLGITYGYFMTKIDGNKNSKSVEVVTGESKVVFTDISQPDTSDPIEPGFKTVKVFTVQNTGNISATYSIYLVDVFNNFNRKQDITYNLYKKEGTITNVTINTDLSELNGWTRVNDPENTEFPTEMTVIAADEKIETPNEIYTYVLKVEYENSEENQNVDQGKTFRFKINLRPLSIETNPFSEGTLAYSILDNVSNNSTGTIYREEPLTKVAEETSNYATGEYENEIVSISSLCSGYGPWQVHQEEDKVYYYGTPVTSYEEAVNKYVYDGCEGWTKKLLSYDSTNDTLTFDNPIEIKLAEQTLSKAEDDYGTSYYYRGNVEDNYVTFAGMCWKIVRIEGDGSTKLILEDQDQPCSTSINGNWAIPITSGGSTYSGNFGYTQHTPIYYTINSMNYLHGETASETSMAIAFKNFQNEFTENELLKLKSGNWCLNDKAYDTNNNLLNATQITSYKNNGNLINYDSYIRLSGNNGFQPTLKCNGTIINDWEDNELNPTPMYVGTITADEAVYAGSKIDINSYTYKNNKNYLINEEFKKGTNGANKNSTFWLLSPARFTMDYTSDSVYVMGYYGIIGVGDTEYKGNFVQNTSGFRPSISLKTGINATTKSDIETYGAPGTINNPYVIE